MLDAVVDYLPAPTDVPAIKGILPDSDEEVVRKSRRLRTILCISIQSYD